MARLTYPEANSARIRRRCTRSRSFREQVIEGLILVRPDFSGNGVVPFVGVAESRVDIEHDAAEWIHAVTDDLTDAVLRLALFHGDARLQNSLRF